MKTPAFLSLIATLLSSGLMAQEAVNPAVMKEAFATAPSSIKPDGSRALDAQGHPTRVYTKSADPEKGREYTKSGFVRISHTSGVTDELPYAPLPILFKVGTDELFGDGLSAANVRKTAEVLRNLIASGCSFVIEGHASVEGNAATNQELSGKRAKKILSLLVEGQGLEERHLAAKGFGSKFHTAELSEGETALQKDRRVLVVRTR